MPPTSLDPNLPRYQEMARHLIERIENREFVTGDRLPSFIEMRRRYGTTQNTVERVYTTLEKEGYIRREPKRGIFVAERGARIRPRIEIVLGDLSLRNDYYMRLLNGIHAEAFRNNAEIVLRNGESSRHWGRTDGTILLSNELSLVDAVTPDMVCTAVMLQGFEHIPTVTADDGAGIRDAVAHLAARGHRRIAYLSLQKVPSERHRSQHRLEAYRDALRAVGIVPDPRWERPLRESGYEPAQGFLNMGRKRMRQWLNEDWAQLDCTALLAHNDETAIAAMQVLQDAGIRIPEQLSVVGFDGIEAGHCVRPQLSTINVPLEEIGARAAALVLEQVRDAKCQPGQPYRRPNRPAERLPVTFVARDSTGPAPNR